MVWRYASRKDKWMTDFLYEGLLLGYSYNDIWSSLVWILSNPSCEVLRYHMLGRNAASQFLVCYAERNYNIKPDLFRLEALVLLIELAHNNFNMPYVKIFSKMSLDEFMDTCGDVIGDYDDRLIKMYLL